MTTAVLTCPGTNRIARGYRADYYHGARPNQEGKCPVCDEWVPVDWNGADPTKGCKTLVVHEVRR